jgi:hypothetical protein
MLPISKSTFLQFQIEFQKATKSAGPGVRLRNPKT